MVNRSSRTSAFNLLETVPRVQLGRTLTNVPDKLAGETRFYTEGAGGGRNMSATDSTQVVSFSRADWSPKERWAVSGLI